MTNDEYWRGDPHLVKFYREAHQMKIEARNQEMWLQGAYFYNAVSVALSNAFRKRGGKVLDYPDKPYPISNRERAKTEAEKEFERKKIISNLDLWRKSWRAKNG